MKTRPQSYQICWPLDTYKKELKENVQNLMTTYEDPTRNNTEKKQKNIPFASLCIIFIQILSNINSVN